MSRITTTELKQLIATDLTELDLFIETASSVVDTYLVTSSCNLPAKRLRLIELYLAAHFLTAREREVTKEKIGDAEVTYSSHTSGTGLRSTEYGARALMLDTCGILARVTGKKMIFCVT